jgi:hypothetical protein
MATVRLEVLIILHRKTANTRGSRQYIRMTLLEISIIKNSSSMVLRRLSIGIMEETVV